MAEQQDRTMKRILLIINCILLAIGVTGGPLIIRLYFIHGGNRVWLSSFLQVAGFPIILIPLFFSYMIRRRQVNTNVDSPKLKIVTMKLPLFLFSTIIGVITGLDGYLYSYGVSRLPVSTAALIVASQLAFTAIFAFFMVKQKFTAYSVNAVVLLTLGAGILALHTNGDRPIGESSKTYVMGFVLTLLAAVLYGFMLPLVELSYIKGRQTITYTLVLEIQLVMCFFASLFSLVGMIVNNDFQSISSEARHYELGEATYYVVLVGSSIIWQMNFVGAVGVIFCASSLFCGVMIALMVPVTEVLAVIFYKENFNTEKGVSLVLSIWGFVSYFYGEFKQAKEMEKNLTLGDDDLPQNESIPNP
ncbi:PREDICTED: purine permease 3-like [Lupinus angustifolius]|uniref:purine permease 3-like n=1 Tax=Lupinus angustifolius TaxID=3871 RepID=UPI00092ECE51|nr:PREDICTED: purine permease 3-like [Lupinus angustifolius]